jgi:excisionase family DNA binding protein
MTTDAEQSGSTSNLNDLISLKRAAELSGLSQSHLSLLIRDGELWGTKLGGRNWFTTETAVKEYLSRNRRPGPKTTD